MSSGKIPYQNLEVLPAFREKCRRTGAHNYERIDGKQGRQNDPFCYACIEVKNLSGKPYENPKYNHIIHKYFINKISEFVHSRDALKA